MRDKYMTDEEMRFRKERGTTLTDFVVCQNCVYDKEGTKLLCWECDSGCNFKSSVRTIGEIIRLIRNIDSKIAEAQMDGGINELKLIRLMGTIDGLEWVMFSETYPSKAYSSDEEE